MFIPQSIKGLIRARTDQLPSQPRRRLQVASVLREEFNSEVLFQVTIDTGVETDPESSFEELLARGFLNSDSENEALVRFYHVLARDAVSIFRELGDIENIARPLFRLAGTMLIMGRYDEGLRILDEAILHTRESGNSTDHYPRSGRQDR